MHRDALHRKVFGADAFPSLDLVMHADASKDRGGWGWARSSVNNLEQNERGSCLESMCVAGLYVNGVQKLVCSTSVMHTGMQGCSLKGSPLTRAPMDTRAMR